MRNNIDLAGENSCSDHDGYQDITPEIKEREYAGTKDINTQDSSDMFSGDSDKKKYKKDQAGYDRYGYLSINSMGSLDSMNSPYH
jgi:hypothetical protein